MKNIIILLFCFFTLGNNLLANELCLQYGIIPYSNVSEIEKSHTKWKHYIESKINRCITLNIESSYGDIIQKFSKNQLDFAFVGPFSYVLTKKVANVEPLVTGVTKNGNSTYKSLMVVTPSVANELNISIPLKGEIGMNILKNKLEQYKKKWMIAFTDESSTSGYAVPNYYMKKVSLDPAQYFKKITFVGTHDAAELVVANDIIPIAITAEMFYYQLLEETKITKKTNIIIWESDEIPESPIIIKKELPKELKLKLQNALISIPKEIVPRLGKTIGYVKTNSLNYTIIEDIHRFLK